MNLAFIKAGDFEMFYSLSVFPISIGIQISIAIKYLRIDYSRHASTVDRRLQFVTKLTDFVLRNRFDGVDLVNILFYFFNSNKLRITNRCIGHSQPGVGLLR